MWAPSNQAGRSSCSLYNSTLCTCRVCSIASSGICHAGLITFLVISMSCLYRCIARRLFRCNCTQTLARGGGARPGKSPAVPRNTNSSAIAHRQMPTQLSQGPKSDGQAQLLRPQQQSQQRKQATVRMHEQDLSAQRLCLQQSPSVDPAQIRSYVSGSAKQKRVSNCPPVEDQSGMSVPHNQVRLL